MAHEINMYSIVQKEQQGFDKAVEECKFRMSRYSVSPNMLIIPPQVSYHAQLPARANTARSMHSLLTRCRPLPCPQLALYMSLAPEAKLTYPLGGPAAAAAFDAGMSGFEARAFRGLGVMTSTPVRRCRCHCPTPITPPVPLLTRCCAHAVRGQRRPGLRADAAALVAGRRVLPHVAPAGLQRGGAPSAVVHGHHVSAAPGLPIPCTLVCSFQLTQPILVHRIYDEESDRHIHIPFEQAMKATGYGAAGGPVGDIFKLAGVSAADVDKADAHAAVRLAFGSTAANSAPVATRNFSDIRNAAAAGQANDVATQPGCLTTAQQLTKLVEEGIWCPVEIVIARPFIEHLMMSAIITVAGRDTGATLFGPADMQISANTSVKTIEGHYTCHTKSVITKPQNVYVMRDVMCSGYVAGGNTRFFGQPAGGTFSVPATPNQVTDALDKRLSFQNDAEGEYDSMLAFGCHYGDGAKRDQVISITDRLLPWEVTRAGAAQKDYFPGGDGNYKEYSKAFRLNTIHFGEDVRAAENMEFISQGSMNNGLCFVGPHRKFNPFSNQYHELIPGQGHFGPDAIPGDARWRRGEAVSLKAARDSMVSLEVAAHAQMYMTKAP